MTTKKTPRNAPCPCGSGRKYKHCCLVQEKDALVVRRAEVARLRAGIARLKAAAEKFAAMTTLASILALAQPLPGKREGI